ncbi:MAG TPA: hypothetical protein VI432_02295, partial [Candidatus Paceibacterota bacterium]
TQNKLIIATDISYEFESGLKIHKKIIEKLARAPITLISTAPRIKNAETSNEISLSIIDKIDESIDVLFVEKIKNRGESAEKERIDLEMKALNTITDEKIKNSVKRDVESVEVKIREMRQIIEKQISVFEQKTQEQLIHRLRITENIFEEGRAKAKDETYKDAFTLLQKAKTIANETKPLIEAKNRFGIEIDFSITNGKNE